MLRFLAGLVMTPSSSGWLVVVAVVAVGGVDGGSDEVALVLVASDVVVLVASNVVVLVASDVVVPVAFDVVVLVASDDAG